MRLPWLWLTERGRKKIYLIKDFFLGIENLFYLVVFLLTPTYRNKTLKHELFYNSWKYIWLTERHATKRLALIYVPRKLVNNSLFSLLLFRSGEYRFDWTDSFWTYFDGRSCQFMFKSARGPPYTKSNNFFSFYFNQTTRNNWKKKY